MRSLILACFLALSCVGQQQELKSTYIRTESLAVRILKVDPRGIVNVELANTSASRVRLFRESNSYAENKDCTFPREFVVKRAQVFTGEIRDPNGVTLPGIDLELRSGASVMKDLKTSVSGRFDFGLVPPGMYRLHIRSAGDPLCAPEVQCGRSGCRVVAKLGRNPATSVTIK